MNTIEKKEVFDIWLANIDERISDWKNLVLKDAQYLVFDYTQESLKEMEKFLLTNYTFNSLEDENFYKDLDACVSYIGETMRKILPGSKWHIYLEDDSNVDFGLPCILTLYSGPLTVHHLLIDIFREKNGNVLVERINKVLAYESLIREQLK